MTLPSKFFRAPTTIQFAKFGLVGVAGFVVDAAFLHLGIAFLGLGRIAAGFFAFPFAVSLTWVGNRIFTFRDHAPEPMAKQWAKFVAVCAIGIVFNRGVYALLVSFVPFVYTYPVLGLLGGTLAGMVFNFSASRRIVFRHKDKEPL